MWMRGATPLEAIVLLHLQRFPNPFSRAAVPDTRNFTALVAGGVPCVCPWSAGDGNGGDCRFWRSRGG